MRTIELGGCPPTSLLSYLKALGVFRILSMQRDPTIRAAWSGDVPYLVTADTETEETLVDFFVATYRPSPFVVPWGGRGFVEASKEPPAGTPPRGKKPPTGGPLVEAFLHNGAERLQDLRDVSASVMQIVHDFGLTRDDIEAKSPTAKSRKRQFLMVLRNRLPDMALSFLDTAYAVTDPENHSLNTLLGGQGGADGRLHFGDNYLQSLWLVLPELSDRRARKIASRFRISAPQALDAAIFGSCSEGSVGIASDSPGLYHPGGVGGPNATEGFEADSIRNPWDFILAIEGLPAFAGGVSRRLSSGASARASFPFVVSVTPAGSASLIDSESANREVWLPVWSRPATYREVTAIFAEGRADTGRRRARTGLDLARAALDLGVDRGVERFHRCAIVKGRIGGDNYHTAAIVGQVEVRAAPARGGHLLGQVEPWLDLLRRVRSKPRYGRLLRQIEDAIFRFTKQPGPERLIEVLRRLGRAEQDLATAGKDRPVRPLHDLEPEWIEACDDGSVELRLAAALGSIDDPKVGPIRLQVEPVQWDAKQRKVRFVDQRTAVWRRGAIFWNLAGVLQRRLLEGRRKETAHAPFGGRVPAALADIQSLIRGMIDETKFEDLFWALCTLRTPAAPLPSWTHRPVTGLSHAYELLKLVHLPFDLELPQTGEKVRIRTDPRIARYLTSGRSREAIDLAYRRLAVSGVRPLGFHRRHAPIPPDYRLADPLAHAAALLFPVRELHRLVTDVLDIRVESTLEVDVSREKAE